MIARARPIRAWLTACAAAPLVAGTIGPGAPPRAGGGTTRAEAGAGRESAAPAPTVPAGAASAGPAAPNLETIRVAAGLDLPLFVTHAPGDRSRIFVLEQRGRVRIVRIDTCPPALLPEPFLDIVALIAAPASPGDERGLLGMAFHPEYAANGHLYVNYVDQSNATVIARYTVSADRDDADESTAHILLAIPQPQTNHNGGWMAFGPDGYLYVSVGDGGAGCDSGAGHPRDTGNAQDLTDNLLGKILRLDADGDDFPRDPLRNYAVPPSNPFVGIDGDDEIWCYGLRNAWRNSFDRLTGDLYIADVGQFQNEEINVQPAAAGGGENYGWRCFEGAACSDVSGCPTTPCSCADAGLTFPVHTYPHPVGLSVTGGYVYRGSAIPGLGGTYFFADFVAAAIWSFEYRGGTAVNLVDRAPELAVSAEGFAVNQVTSFGEDASGELYICDRGTFNQPGGDVYRVIAISPADCALPHDGQVTVLDLLALLAQWDPPDMPAGPGAPGGGPCDQNGDGIVDVTDLLALLAEWTSCSR